MCKLLYLINDNLSGVECFISNNPFNIIPPYIIDEYSVLEVY